jgi:hypothetical protein
MNFHQAGQKLVCGCMSCHVKKFLSCLGTILIEKNMDITNPSPLLFFTCQNCRDQIGLPLRNFIHIVLFSQKILQEKQFDYCPHKHLTFSSFALYFNCVYRFLSFVAQVAQENKEQLYCFIGKLCTHSYLHISVKLKILTKL